MSVRPDSTYDDNSHRRSMKRRSMRRRRTTSRLHLSAWKLFSILFGCAFSASRLYFFLSSESCVCVCVAFQHIRPFGRFSRLLGRWHLSCLEKVQKKPFVALPPTTLSSAAVNLIYFNGPRVVQTCICGCVCVYVVRLKCYLCWYFWLWFTLQCISSGFCHRCSL